MDIQDAWKLTQLLKHLRRITSGWQKSARYNNDDGNSNEINRHK